MCTCVVELVEKQRRAFAHWIVRRLRASSSPSVTCSIMRHNGAHLKIIEVKNQLINHLSMEFFCSKLIDAQASVACSFVYPPVDCSAMCNSIMFRSNVEAKFFSHRANGRWSDKTYLQNTRRHRLRKLQLYTFHRCCWCLSRWNKIISSKSPFFDLQRFILILKKKKKKRTDASDWISPRSGCVVSALCLLVLSSASMHTLLVLLLRVACSNFFERRDVYNDFVRCIDLKDQSKVITRLRLCN